MKNFLQSPLTFVLILINAIIFAILWSSAPVKEGGEWTLHLLHNGALFNPYTFDGEWYRLFTHMFLHTSLLHLAFNMYALFSVGRELEYVLGPKKFILVYLLCGVFAAFTSLYWSLFQTGVGASGAIFGLFGYSLILNLVASRKLGRPIAPIAINFGIFLLINVLLAKAVNADNAAHFGGLAAGIILSLITVYTYAHIREIKYEYLFILLLLIIYFAMPRYQVNYFNFFQYVLAAKDSAQTIFNKNASDELYLEALKKSDARWDSALHLLNSQTYVPKELRMDTFDLRRYLQLRKKENAHRYTMIERESYIYIDSIELVQEEMGQFQNLEYPLGFYLTKSGKEAPDTTAQEKPLERIKVYYNEDWEEITGPPFKYFRVGTRDSLGRWQGSLRDYYANGDVQMKGRYTNDERNGIFIYYSDHHTYESAGRYHEDNNVGKWETYHQNGKLESEVYYTDRYYLENLWDSAGNQFVKDGNGRVKELYDNGVVAHEGEYRNGNREGYWYGRHKNGSMYYEENYFQGRLVNGRSRNLKGETFVYDESSFFPLPEGGYKKLKEYLEKETVKQNNIGASGSVRLSFRVTVKGSLTDFKIVGSLSKQADDLAKQILLAGPRWIPAKEYGNEKVDGFAYAEINF